MHPSDVPSLLSLAQYKNTQYMSVHAQPSRQLALSPTHNPGLNLYTQTLQLGAWQTISTHT
jgi:hypothetical protein